MAIVCPFVLFGHCIVCPFVLFGHCIVCPFRFTDSDYPFSIIKLFLSDILDFFQSPYRSNKIY
jgi:hypothetical protein